MMKRATVVFGLILTGFLANAQIVANLEQGGSVFWKFNSGQYTITGAVNMSGNIDPSDPIEFVFQDLNGDGIALDVRLRVQDLFPDIGINYELDLIATVLSDDGTTALVRWFASDNPNQCVTVNVGGTEVTALITHLEGALQGIITRIQCQPNPYSPNWRNVTLQLNENGGDPNNYLLAQGYLFCVQQDWAYTEARIFDMDWDAYGGGFTAAYGNVNGDDIVDDADLLQVLFNFGGSDPASDTNNDGVVDDADLLTVLFNFGSSC